VCVCVCVCVCVNYEHRREALVSICESESRYANLDSQVLSASTSDMFFKCEGCVDFADCTRETLHNRQLPSMPLLSQLGQWQLALGLMHRGCACVRVQGWMCTGAHTLLHCICVGTWTQCLLHIFLIAFSQRLLRWKGGCANLPIPGIYLMRDLVMACLMALQQLSIVAFAMMCLRAV